MPPIDITRFHQTFFEESFEGLDAMETALLRLSPESADAEAINGIFRAAHSIKGGSATFGFAAVAEFTHLLETLLDQMRGGMRATTMVEIDALLRAVDVLRGLLNEARDGGAADGEAVRSLSVELTALLAADAAAPVADVTGIDAPAPLRTPAAPAGWRIVFTPRPELFASGNDPLRILRELTLMGPTTIRCDAAALPALDEASPEACYLAWEIELRADCPRDAITDVFAWVEDECSLTIVPIAGAPRAPAGASAKPESRGIENRQPVIRPTAEAQSGERRPEAARSEGSSIRVATEKIDTLVNLVGELVITQAMLQQLAGVLDPVQHEKLFAGLSQLDRNTRLLQEAVMSTRMLPVEFVFSRFPRVVRDLADKLGKQVRLQTMGEGTELDKSVIERIADPLTHLVRNSLDHGIERPDERRAAGKDALGTVRLSAAHQGGHIVIEVADDGRGLDRERILAKARERGLPTADTMADDEVWQLIFAPGFSTADAVTAVSGRGVGMDVVKKNIEALSGSVQIASEAGRGTRMTIRLPLTLAILDGMSVRVGREIFIVPINSVVESLQPSQDQVRSMVNRAHVVKLRSEYVPLVTLHELFGVSGAIRDPRAGILIVLESGERRIAVLVDELVGQQQVVIKSLESNYRRVPGVSGATILGDGHVALIVDVAEFIRLGTRAAAA